MTSLEKKSFYSFLGLYIISSTMFIVLSAYWYYDGQKASLENAQYHSLEHIADKVSQKIINAHMHETKLELPSFQSDIVLALIDTNREIQYGSLVENTLPLETGYIRHKTYNILISDSPQEHLNIEYVVVQSNVLAAQVEHLQKRVFVVMALSIFVMIILAFVLSRLFMRPINQKIKQIEDFISDTAHELNTPITALRMSVSRALSEEPCDKHSLKNISISTKQLFDIYNALSYLSFESEEEELTRLDICVTLNKSISYYQELAQRKRIEMSIECESFDFEINETKLTMLFGNLINNAIKYSPVNSKIEISFKKGVFRIKDNGIGISKEGLSKIFERFNRETNYSGGFGIGLSIVKKISLEYGLRLDVESTLGEGSCFSISF